MQNALSIRVSENQTLSTQLLSLEETMEAAARQNLESSLAEVGQSLSQYTATEQLAMVQTEKLRLVNGLDLASVAIRGKILKQIEEQGLFSVHPNGYNRIEDLAKEAGISSSMYSDIRAMYEYIFPYFEQVLHIPVAQVWETVGTANFRALVPVLRAIITGEEPGRESARATYNRIMNDVAATLAAANGGRQPSDDEVRRAAVSELIERGQQATTRELQGFLRDGAVTPALQPTLIIAPDGRKYMLAEVNDDQLMAISRRLGAHMGEPDRVILPRDPQQRQNEAFRHPTIRSFTRIIEE